MIMTRGSQWCGPQSIASFAAAFDASGGDI